MHSPIPLNVESWHTSSCVMNAKVDVSRVKMNNHTWREGHSSSLYVDSLVPRPCRRNDSPTRPGNEAMYVDSLTVPLMAKSRDWE